LQYCILQYCILQYDLPMKASVSTPPALSTTSYAVLGMLALRSWSPYELTQQMRRSLAYCWPTSERALYAEPERLVAAGFAAVTTADGSARPRRSYSITPAGREAMRAWLATPPSPVRIVNEPLLRLLFADQAGTDALLQSLTRLRETVAEQHAIGAEQVRPYLDGDGPFTDRAHLVALFADLYGRLFTVLEVWASEAIAEVNTWSTTADLGLTDHARAAIERAVASVMPR